MAPTRKPPLPMSIPRPRITGTDIYNSTSTGHQVGDGVSKPAAYHKARAARLQVQFSGGGGGRKVSGEQTSLLRYFGGVKAAAAAAGVEKRGKEVRVTRAGDVAMAVTAVTAVTAAVVTEKDMAVAAVCSGIDTATGSMEGSRDRKGEKKVLDISTASTDINIITGASATSKASSSTTTATKEAPPPTTSPAPIPTTTSTAPAAPESKSPRSPPAPTPSLPTPQQPPQIFAPLTIHISGPTTPHISDHTLKRLLCMHGARLAVAVSQRTTTHVLLGGGGGGGGALAAGKIQKEVARRKGKNGGG